MTMTPFDLWAGMWRTGQDMLETSLKMAETAVASQAVIESRTRTMAEAVRNPLGADYAELGRMVPEKLSALAEAGAAAMDDVQAVQSMALANWQMLMGIAGSGKIPSANKLNSIAKRSTAIVERSARATGKALGPFHAGATGNARRLARSRRRGH